MNRILCALSAVALVSGSSAVLCAQTPSAAGSDLTIASVAISASAPTVIGLRLAMIEVSPRDRKKIGVKGDVDFDALAQLQAKATAHGVTLNVKTYPELTTTEGVAAYLHLPRADHAMTVGADAKFIPTIMPTGTISLSIMLQTQRRDGAGQIQTGQMEIARVLRDGIGQWIGSCPQKHGATRLFYVTASKLSAASQASAPLKTQLLLTDTPSPFESDIPNARWTAARRTIRIGFTDYVEREYGVHPLALGNSPDASSREIAKVIAEDGVDTEAARSIPGATSNIRAGGLIGDDIHVVTHMEPGDAATVTTTFTANEVEAGDFDADGKSSIETFQNSLLHTFHSGESWTIGQYLTRKHTHHEIVATVEILPTRASVAVARRM